MTVSRRTPATEVRAKLIDAGRVLLERDGPAGLTIRTVATEAGVAPMSVYNHFGDKDGLLDGLVTDAFREFGAAIAVTDSEATERLRHSGRAYREFAITYPVVYSLMFSTGCAPDPFVATSAFSVLADLVRYGQAAGVLRPDDPFAIAMQIWSCTHGAMSLELAGAGPPGVDYARNFEHLLELLLRGLHV